MAYLENSQIVIADNQSELFPDCKCSENSKYQFGSSNDYSRYILCCLKTVFVDGLMAYELPVNFKLYRGHPSYGREPSRTQGIAHFSFNAFDASRQGYVHDYVVHKAPRLLGFDRVSNLTMIKAMAIKDHRYDVVQACDANFKVKEGIIERPQCDEIANYVILGYLCTLGYQGYITAPDKKYPSDVYLCDSEKHVSTGNYSPYSEQFVTSLNNYL